MHDYEKDFPNNQNPNIGFLMFEISNNYSIGLQNFMVLSFISRKFRQWFTCVSTKAIPDSFLFYRCSYYFLPLGLTFSLFYLVWVSFLKERPPFGSTPF